MRVPSNSCSEPYFAPGSSCDPATPPDSNNGQPTWWNLKWRVGPTAVPSMASSRAPSWGRYWRKKDKLGMNTSGSKLKPGRKRVRY